MKRHVEEVTGYGVSGVQLHNNSAGNFVGAEIKFDGTKLEATCPETNKNE